MQRFEVATDRQRLGETRAVVQFEHRYFSQWIDGQEVLAAVDAAGDVDPHGFDLQAFLGHEHPHATRARGEGVVEQLQWESSGKCAWGACSSPCSGCPGSSAGSPGMARSPLSQAPRSTSRQRSEQKGRCGKVSFQAMLRPQVGQFTCNR